MGPNEQIDKNMSQNKRPLWLFYLIIIFMIAGALYALFNGQWLPLIAFVIFGAIIMQNKNKYFLGKK